MLKKFSLLVACAAPFALAISPATAQEQAAPAASKMAAPASAAAPSTAAAAPAVGTIIYDATGAEVGKVKSVSAPNFVIDTGKNTATLALSALGTSPKGPILALSRMELDAAAEKAAADAAAALASSIVVDAPVMASDGSTVLGKIAEVSATDFVLDTGKTKVKLPKTSVAKGDAGLMIGMTAQEFATATATAVKATAGR